MTDHHDTAGARVKLLEKTLRAIVALADGPRATVNDDNIWRHFRDLNSRLIDVRVNARAVLAASRPATQVVDREVVARALCESGKFETGEGTCSLLCMDQLGSVRKNGPCSHLTRVHGDLADTILSLLCPAEPAEAEGVREQ